MRIRIDDFTKGTFSLPTPIDTRDKHYKNGVTSIGCWVGFYNIHEEQTCRWGNKDGDSTEFKIDLDKSTEFKIDFYSSNQDLSKVLKREVPELTISLNKITGLIDLTLLERVDLWLTDTVKYMIGLDNDDKLAGWLRGDYEGDRPVEFFTCWRHIYLFR